MPGSMRWVLFFSVIVAAAGGVAALWIGWTPELMKGLASIAIVTIAAIALYALRPRP